MEQTLSHVAPVSRGSFESPDKEALIGQPSIGQSQADNSRLFQKQ